MERALKTFHAVRRLEKRLLRPQRRLGDEEREEARRADVHDRHEFKYVLSAATARRVQAFIERIGLLRNKDSIDGPYTLTSLYFDTPTLEDYYDKLAGLKYRRKLRARIYERHFGVEEPEVWFEIKEKHDMTVRKKRVKIPHEAWKLFLARDIVALFKHPAIQTSSILREFLYLYLMKCYRPTIVVRYERTAYAAEFFSPVRVTFDGEMQTCKWRNFAYTHPVMAAIHPGCVVMEVKFGGAIPWWFQEMLTRFKLSRSAFSKYVEATDALNKLNPMPR